MNRSRLRTLLLYSAGTVLTAASTLLTIPAVIAVKGAAAWGDLILGQTLGTFLAVVVGWGWIVTGPSLAASSAASAVWPAFRTSLLARSGLLLPALAVLAPVLALIGPRNGGVSAVAAVVPMVGALDGAWVLVGRARTGTLLLAATVPRVVGTVCGTLVVVGGGSLLLLPLLQLVGAASAVLASTLAVRRWFGRRRSWRTTPAEVVAGLRAQLHGMLTALLAAAYVALPITVVAAIAPAGLPALGIGDRLMRYGVLALAPALGLIQAWIPSAGAALVPARTSTALRSATGLAVASAAVYAVAAPLAAGVLSGGEVAPDPVVLGAYAVAVGAVVWTQVAGPAALVALGAVRSLSFSTFVGAAFGLLTIVPGAALAGARGAAIAFAASEVLVLVVQGRTLRRLHRPSSAPRR